MGMKGELEINKEKKGNFCSLEFGQMALEILLKMILIDMLTRRANMAHTQMGGDSQVSQSRDFLLHVEVHFSWPLNTFWLKTGWLWDFRREQNYGRYLD